MTVMSQPYLESGEKSQSYVRRFKLTPTQSACESLGVATKHNHSVDTSCYSSSYSANSYLSNSYSSIVNRTVFTETVTHIGVIQINVTYSFNNNTNTSIYQKLVTT